MSVLSLLRSKARDISSILQLMYIEGKINSKKQNIRSVLIAFFPFYALSFKPAIKNRILCECHCVQFYEMSVGTNQSVCSYLNFHTASFISDQAFANFL